MARLFLQQMTYNCLNVKKVQPQCTRFKKAKLLDCNEPDLIRQ